MQLALRILLLTLIAVFAIELAAYAQDLVKPAETILDEIKKAILGPVGLIIGALLLIAVIIAAFSERSQVQPIHILWVLMGLGLIYGSFPIIETIQKLVGGN